MSASNKDRGKSSVGRLARAESALAVLKAMDEGGYSFLEGGGRSRIVISAPHAAEHLRGDMLLPPEAFTGVVACSLAEEFGCSAFVKVTVQGGDPNDDEQSAYRDALAEFVEDSGARLVLDLHQMSPKRPHDLMVGTGEGRNVLGHSELANAIVSAFSSCGIVNVGIDEYFRALGANRVATSIARRCGIPCLQLELNSALVYEGATEYGGAPGSYCPDRVLEAFNCAVADLESLLS